MRSSLPHARSCNKMAAESESARPTTSSKKATCWKYFEKVLNSENSTKGKAKYRVSCTFCGDELAYHGATSAMHEHLKRKHPIETAADQPQPKAAKQMKLEAFIARKTSKERADHINTLVTGVIVRDLRPVNIVNGDGFKALMAYLEPGYRLPSDRYFMGLIERKYVEVKEGVTRRLQQETFVSLTGDIWTSIAIDAYLTLIVHFLSEAWEMCSVVLGTKPLSDRHTGENIVAWMEEMLAEFSIGTDKVVAFVHDSGSNINLAGRRLHDKYGWYTEACAGHTLQLCVKAGLQIRVIEVAIAAARRLVKHFRKSDLATLALRKRQEQMQAEQHNLIQDVTTRWNSTYFLIERLLEQRWPVTAVLSDASITKSADRSLDLTTEQWNLLAELKPILHVLQVATTYLSAEYNVSISALLPIIHGLSKSMEVTEEDLPAIRQCKCAISLELRRRWNLDNIDPTNPGSDLVALCLHPRFKQAKFLDSHKRLDLQLTITSLAHQAKASLGSDTQEKETTSAKKELELRPKALDLLLGSDSPGSSIEDSDPVQDEVDDYFKQQQQPRDSSPLEWWKVNKCRFPTLAGLARKYLAITATSTPAERVFSVAGLIVSRLRASLTPEYVDMLVFLNKNMDLK